MKRHTPTDLEVERLLRGQAVDGHPDLAALVAGMRDLPAEPRRTSPTLTTMLRDGFDPACPPPPVVEVPAWRSPRRARRVAGAVAGLSLGAKVLGGVGVAAASVGTAAGVGVLPQPLQDGVIAVVHTVAPFVPAPPATPSAPAPAPETTDDDAGSSPADDVAEQRLLPVPPPAPVPPVLPEPAATPTPQSTPTEVPATEEPADKTPDVVPPVPDVPDEPGPDDPQEPSEEPTEEPGTPGSPVCGPGEPTEPAPGEDEATSEQRRAGTPPGRAGDEPTTTEPEPEPSAEVVAAGSDDCTGSEPPAEEPVAEEPAEPQQA